jgi:hypothetical protein
VHAAPEARVRRGLGERSASIREIAREILTRRDSTVSAGAKLRSEIVDVVRRAGRPIGANAIASKMRRRRSLVRAAIRRLVDDSILVSAEGGFLVSPEANPFASTDELSSLLELVRIVMGPTDAARVETRVRELEARFVEDPPPVSMLRALVSELRAFVPRADQATNEALRRLESQLALAAPRRAPDRASSTDRATAPASPTPNRRRPV